MTAEPDGPGLQIVGAVVEFHLPAQTAPLVLTSTMLLLLLDQVGVRLTTVPPLASRIVAVSARNRPASRDTVDGLTVMVAAVGVFDLLLLPQPLIRPVMKTRNTTA